MSKARMKVSTCTPFFKVLVKWFIAVIEWVSQPCFFELYVNCLSIYVHELWVLGLF